MIPCRSRAILLFLAVLLGQWGVADVSFRAIAEDGSDVAKEADVAMKFFKKTPVVRWNRWEGSWEMSEDVDVLKVETRDIYRSPEEPGHLAWAALWKEKDGTIKTSFSRVSGNPGLEPSYRPTYGRRPWEQWVAFAEELKMRLGPKDALDTTKLEQPTLATHDQGETWEYLGVDHEPRGGNIRLAFADDGSLVRKGLAIIRCRDGRLVSTASSKEWKSVEHPSGHPLTTSPEAERAVIAVRESLDGGKNWTPLQFIAPEGANPEIISKTTEENDIVELDDGRILALIRSQPSSMGVIQTYLTRVGPGQYTATPPTLTPMPHSGMPEVARCPDGVIWYLGSDGLWYSVDDGASWNKGIYVPSYYGKMLALGPGKILCVTSQGCGDNPYPNYHDASIRQSRLFYKRIVVFEQTDEAAEMALARRTSDMLTDLHLHAEVQINGANGLAFGIQPDGRSYYFFGVVLKTPGSQVYDSWFPPEVVAEQLRETINRGAIPEGDPMVVLARIDNGKRVVLRSWRCSDSPKQGDWMQMQVKVSGDLIQAAIKNDRGDLPIYVGVRDETYPSGGIGLVTDKCTGTFKNVYVWDSPQMIRDLWR